MRGLFWKFGRLVAIGYSDGTPAVGYTYTRAGRPVRASSSVAAYGFRYDDCGRLVGETNSVADAILIRSYDAFGRPSGLSLAPGYEVDYGYDPAGRFAAVTGTVASATSVANYGYIADSDLLAGYAAHVVGSSASLNVSRTHDNLGRTLFVSNTVGGTTVSAYGYQYNTANQRTRIDVGGSATPLSGSRWEHGYDSLGQVTNSARRFADSTAVSGQRFGYRYDDIGNRAQASGARPEDPEVYSVNLLNQYTQRTVPRWIDLLGSAHTGAVVTVKSVVATGAPPAYTRAVRQKDYFHAAVPVSTNGAARVGFDIFAVLGNAGSNGEDAVSTETGSKWIAPTPEIFTHDADGNLLSDGRFAYTWDGENRLTEVSNATTRVLFSYDPMSRRVGKTVNTTNTTRFVYDGWAMIREASATATNAYVYGQDLSGTMQGAGTIGGLLFANLNGAAAFYAYDANGNVTDLIGPDGEVRARYEYAPFGETLIQTGPLASVNPFRFSTKYLDAETGCYYYGYRLYIPPLGRWLSRDPIGEIGGLHLYTQSENQTVSRVDWLGLKSSFTFVGDPNKRSPDEMQGWVGFWMEMDGDFTVYSMKWEYKVGRCTSVAGAPNTEEKVRTTGPHYFYDNNTAVRSGQQGGTWADANGKQRNYFNPFNTMGKDADNKNVPLETPFTGQEQDYLWCTHGDVSVTMQWATYGGNYDPRQHGFVQDGERSAIPAMPSMDFTWHEYGKLGLAQAPDDPVKHQGVRSVDRGVLKVRIHWEYCGQNRTWSVSSDPPMAPGPDRLRR